MLKHNRALLNVVLVGGSIVGMMLLAKLSGLGTGHRDMNFMVAAAVVGFGLVFVSTRWLMDALTFVFGKQLVFGLLTVILLSFVGLAAARIIIPVGLAVQVVRYIVLRVQYEREKHAGVAPV